MPDGYDADQRDKPGGFTGDPDIMDTWATSSLTPQIAGHWIDDPDLFARVFPMDLRPQAHEIIRTWLFSTVVRSHFEFDALPFANAAISGFVFDPERKKLSKSQGNSPDDPNAVMAEYGSDAVRYWAAGGRPGMDVAFDRNQLKVGRRLAIKLLNASKFVLSFGEPAATATPSQPLDLAVLEQLAAVVDDATERVRVLRLHTGARPDRAVLLVVLRRLRRAGEIAGVRRRRIRARDAAHRAVGPAATVRADPAVRHGRGLVVVAGRFDPSRRPGPLEPSCRHRETTVPCSTSPARCWPRSARRRLPPRSRCGQTWSARGRVGDDRTARGP